MSIIEEFNERIQENAIVFSSADLAERALKHFSKTGEVNFFIPFSFLNFDVPFSDKPHVASDNAHVVIKCEPDNSICMDVIYLSGTKLDFSCHTELEERLNKNIGDNNYRWQVGISSSCSVPGFKARTCYIIKTIPISHQPKVNLKRLLKVK